MRVYPLFSLKLQNVDACIALKNVGIMNAEKNNLEEYTKVPPPLFLRFVENGHSNTHFGSPFFREGTSEGGHPR